MGKMAKKKSLYVRKTFFANKVLLGFDDDAIFQLGTDFYSLGDDLHIIDLGMNHFEEGGNDMNQVWSKFCLKIYTDQFCKIEYIS